MTSSSKTIQVLCFVLAAGFLCSCKFSLSFSGASISPDVKTFSVASFPNRAPVFQPSLSYEFTNGLQDKIQSQSRLKLVRNNGDVSFEGEITDYSTRDVAISGADNLASQTRLSITIRVKYTNQKDTKQNFDQSFSRYADFPTSKNLSEVENELIKNIVDQITEDIFNKAFINW